MRSVGHGIFWGAALAMAMGSAAQAQTVIEQAAEYRFQLDFHVPDAALQKMLPAGWEPAIAAAGPAKDANIRMIFITCSIMSGTLSAARRAG